MGTSSMVNSPMSDYQRVKGLFSNDGVKKLDLVGGLEHLLFSHILSF